MKPDSKSTEPHISASKPTTSEFGQISPTEWRVSGKTVTIDQFIEDEAQHVNSTDLRVLKSFTGRLLDKLKETNTDEYPGLGEAVHVIIGVLEAPATQQVKDPLPHWLAETGFAAGYFLKKFDLIPDHLPKIGLADDTFILQRVIERNQSELHCTLAESNNLTASNRPLEGSRAVVNSVGLMELTQTTPRDHPALCLRLTNLGTMTAKYADFREWMTMELIDFVQSQASVLSVADLDRLIADLPALRERFTTIPSQTYPYLSDHLEFISLVVEDQVTGPNRDPISQTVSEAAFALLYFQSTTDLIPDPIPGMGLLDDAMIVSLVLRRHEDVFKRSSHAYKLRWPLPTFDIDQLLSVVSPLRLDSFYSSMKTLRRLSAPD